MRFSANAGGRRKGFRCIIRCSHSHSKRIAHIIEVFLLVWTNQQVFIENCLARKDDLKIISSTDIRSPRSIDSVSISSSHQPG